MISTALHWWSSTDVHPLVERNTLEGYWMGLEGPGFGDQKGFQGGLIY